MANPSGYGEMKQDGRVLFTHRIAFEQAYGSIPDGMIVGHTCDTPGCCRNDGEGWYEVNGILHPRRGHLWLGTHQDNQADKVAKERQATGDSHGARLHPESVPRGEQQGRAKLTERDIRNLRSRHAQGGVSIVRLAREFNIGTTQVRRIINRKSWQHVE